MNHYIITLKVNGTDQTVIVMGNDAVHAQERLIDWMEDKQCQHGTIEAIMRRNPI